MHALDFFRLRYDNVHPGVWERATGELSESQIRTRPHPLVNTVAWQVRHLARCEDVGLNRLVVDRARLTRIVAEEGMLGEHAGWVEPMWAEQRNVGWFLAQLALTHTTGHLYQIGMIRSLWGRAGR